MAERLSGLVLREGLREYYDPFTGEGLGAREFAWTSLILELAEPLDGEPRSGVDSGPCCDRAATCSGR